MEETLEGTFYFDNEKQDWCVHFVKPNKKEAIIKCNPKQISRNLSQNKDEKTQVKFETDKRYYTEVLNVRPLNEESTVDTGNIATGDFHNPYNFFSSIPRGSLTGELGDKPPCGHDRYCAEKLHCANAFVACFA